MKEFKTNLRLILKNKQFRLNLSLNIILLLVFGIFLVTQRVLLEKSNISSIVFNRLILINILLAIAIIIEIAMLILKTQRIIKENQSTVKMVNKN